MLTDAIKEAIKHRTAFVPRRTKADLALWIAEYLGLEFPDVMVDEDSTTTPMDYIWTVYNKALNNLEPERNRILAYASRDSFKCVKKGTRLLSKSGGLVPIEDARVGDVIWTGWSWRPIQKWIHDGKKSGVEVTLANGMRLTTSPIHRVWAWAPDSAPTWKTVADLTPADLVATDTTAVVEAPFDAQDFEDGYVLGLLQGDGCLTRLESEGVVTLSNVDAQVLKFWSDYCFRRVGRYPTQSKSRICDWTIWSRDLSSYLLSLGLKQSYSFEKDIPHAALRSRSAMSGFVSGLLDTDGTITARGAVEFPLTAKKMMEGLLVMLHALGVPARFRSNRLYAQHGQNHAVHRVWVNANDFPALKAAGVRLTAHKAYAKHWHATPALTSNKFDAIPRAQLAGLGISSGYATMTREKAKRSAGLTDEGRQALERRWVAVESVVTTEADFYDLTVDVDHSYWSDGFISHNTLGTAVIEFLMIVHLNRDVGHMAAIEKQARQATGYVQSFFNKSYFKPFVVGSNQRTKEFVRYESQDTGDNITQKEWAALTPLEQTKYTRYGAKLDIVICTMAGANGLHVPFFVVDEVDLASPDAYEESKMIPTSDENRAAITTLTSTRKFAFGLVQDEIDKAPKTGLKILHWNILDIARKCPPQRHHPEKPKVKVHVNKDLLKVYREEEFNRLPGESQDQCVEEEAFAGCLSHCSLYAMCRGRLATVQQTARFPQATNLQKPIEHLIAQFASISEPVANAQLLCRKPSQTGLIYPFLDRDVHVKSPAAIAEMVTGTPHPEGFTKADLIALFRSRPTTKFVAGMDFGYTHNFVEVTAAIDGNRAFVLDCVAQAEILTNQQIELCQANTGHYRASIYADPENPQAVKEFKDAGFEMKKWTKGPGSVLAGIEIVRWMIRPLIGEPLLYFIEGDPGVDFLFLRLGQYHWKVNAAGNPTDIPDDHNDDECDALRYLLMNKFQKTRAVVRRENIQQSSGDLKQAAAEVHRRQILEHATGGEISSIFGGQAKAVRKGKLFFSAG